MVTNIMTNKTKAFKRIYKAIFLLKNISIFDTVPKYNIVLPLKKFKTWSNNSQKVKANRIAPLIEKNPMVRQINALNTDLDK